MTERDQSNSGALFINSRKKSDKSPDRTGPVHVGSEKVYVSAWEESTGGKPFLSCKISDFNGESGIAGECELHPIAKRSDNSPDLKGEIHWTGGPYHNEPWGIVAWKKKSGSGVRFLSIRLNPPEDSSAHPDRQNPSRTTTAAASTIDDDDDIPF